MAETAAADSARAADRRRAAEGSVRETFESIVIAFVLAFVFRAFVVEAFVIPTGSMAPTLLGQHDGVTCPMCGYSFPVGPVPSGYGGGASGVLCPMCEYGLDASSLGPDSGDRILVLKYVYTFAEPTRYDVVVFKNPRKPEENYIKRLVGLPGEQLKIVGGNVYTRRLVFANGVWAPPPNTVEWEIQRKPQHVQHAVWQPIYHSRYYPLDAEERGWEIPWQPVNAEGWTFNEQGAHYVYDSGQQDLRGTLEFRFNDRTAIDYFAYNMHSGSSVGEQPVQEMRVAADVQPQAPGLRVELMTTGRLERFRAVIGAEGAVLIQQAPAAPENGDNDTSDHDWVTLKEGGIAPLPAGQATSLEFWHTDQALSVWVDNVRVLEHEYVREPNSPDMRHPPQMEPRATIAVQGSPCTIRSMELDRDLYYADMQGHRQRFGSADNPAIIPHDRFYVLGDNSLQSEDSRLWFDVDEWVEHYTNVEIGLVPRDLMIGRAFFVYFPAPLPAWNGNAPVVPHFGQMRFIH